MPPPKKEAEVVPLFRRSHEIDVAEEVAVGRALVPSPTGAATVAAPAAIDLAGQAKIVMVVGPGNVGKTTVLRWVVEAMFERNGTALLAAVDPENRSLADYVGKENVHVPGSYVPAAVTKWLEDFLVFAMEKRGSAAVDFGGGDTSLAALLASAPNLAEMLDEGGLTPVLFYVLGPRPDDLATLATFERSGFQPKATAIILNEGLGDPTLPREDRFGPVLRHSAYKAAVARGAVPIWMPRLIPAQEVEVRRVLFGQARDGISPAGRNVTPLGPFARARVGQWLSEMERRFSPIATWLP